MLATRAGLDQEQEQEPEEVEDDDEDDDNEEEDEDDDNEEEEETERRRNTRVSSSSVSWSLSSWAVSVRRRAGRWRRRGRSTRTTTSWLVVLPCLLVLVTVWYSISFRPLSPARYETTSWSWRQRSSVGASSTSGSNSTLTTTLPGQHVPTALLEMGVYEEPVDFQNAQGQIPTGWEDPAHSDDDVEEQEERRSGTTTTTRTWGPCHQTLSTTTAASWTWHDRRRQPSRNQSSTTTNDAQRSFSPEYYQNADVHDFRYPKTTLPGAEKDEGYCRPGFLIIGAGKCGTSSLYHYLVGHPRVIPALEKQLHYFKYHAPTKPLSWYYGHFPTPRSFLEHGALMTGEASPGYLPYPDVAYDIKNVWQTVGWDVHTVWKQHGRLPSRVENATAMTTTTMTTTGTPPPPPTLVPPHIVMVGREPLARLYSSYRYNYVVPTLESLRTRGHPRNASVHPRQANDDYYTPYLFTLAEMVRAELTQLRKCLHTDWGAQRTYDKWKTYDTYHAALLLQRRNTTNTTTAVPPPLIDVDGICYGGTISRTIYREQWSELQAQHPQKVLLNRNLHLTQALIGRSLYTFPLEWWYLNFPTPTTTDGGSGGVAAIHPNPRITFVCTEDLSQPATLNELAGRLGLPPYDGFATVVDAGAYNVGGHRGYDTPTRWDELGTTAVANTNHTASSSASASSASPKLVTKTIPLPDDLYQELQDFIAPINERLFALTGKRCDW